MTLVTLTPRRLALGLVTLGGIVVVVGLALVWQPLAIVAAGAGVMALGAFGIDLPKPRRRGDET